FARAGYRELLIEPLDTVMNLGATLDDAAEQVLNIGPLARAATGLDDATREKIRTTVRDALAPYQKPEGVAPPAACWLVRAAP
ncbi:MAG TPA: hypothetical protein VHE09_12620, partial [Rhizomicrobium sp.]|nr:hypothetical protein [Rhizomicrobium sp.]